MDLRHLHQRGPSTSTPRPRPARADDRSAFMPVDETRLATADGSTGGGRRSGCSMPSWIRSRSTARRLHALRARRPDVRGDRPAVRDRICTVYSRLRLARRGIRAGLLRGSRRASELQEVGSEGPAATLVAEEETSELARSLLAAGRARREPTARANASGAALAVGFAGGVVTASAAGSGASAASATGGAAASAGAGAGGSVKGAGVALALTKASSSRLAASRL